MLPLSKLSKALNCIKQLLWVSPQFEGNSKCGNNIQSCKSFHVSHVLCRETVFALILWADKLFQYVHTLVYINFNFCSLFHSVLPLLPWHFGKFLSHSQLHYLNASLLSPFLLKCPRRSGDYWSCFLPT